VQMVGPAHPPGVHPLRLEPSWRQSPPNAAPTTKWPKPDWDDRCCVAGDGGLGIALSHKLEQLAADQAVIDQKRRASFAQAQRQYARPVSARPAGGRTSRGDIERSPSPQRPGSSPQRATYVRSHLMVHDPETGLPLIVGEAA